ncbi:MAG: NAD(P)-binding domain-containing protein, partial [archaeon]|nr:NAD(P)-binding domain-containing protein [archaeon]
MLGACAAGWDGLGLPEFASTASSPSPGEARSAIGIIGMAVMGENLALNLESHGLRVSVYNRNMSRVSDFLGPSGRGFGKRNIVSSPSLGEFVESLSSPRLVMLVIKAGAGVDQMIDVLVPLLRAGDVIIDGGNSNFHDSNQRALLLEAQGILFVGAGISSGEEGALSGLSIMPGGSAAAWPLIRDIFTTIAARVDGQPCCDWMSDAGAGHYVKMVHNG